MTGQTEPRTRKSRVAKRNGGGLLVDAGGYVMHKLARAGSGGVLVYLARALHWRARGSVWPVISPVSREGGGCRKYGILPAKAGWPNGMEVGCSLRRAGALCTSSQEPALARFWCISQGQGVSEMRRYSQGHNTSENPTSIPFGLHLKPKTPRISGTHKINEKARL